jgi:flagellar biosynthetic protein FlhB
MSEEDQGEKQFEASQRKLDDARAKGEVVKSTDLTSAASYLGLVAAMFAVGGTSLIAVGSALRILLDQADNLSSSMFAGAPNPLMGTVFWTTGLAMAPWFAIPAAAALLCLIVQQAIVFAPDKLVPKLSRISPITGAKNKFGRQGFFEFVKSFVKLLIYCVVLGVFLAGQMDQIVGSAHLSAGMVSVVFGEMTLSLMLIVVVIASVLGLVDFTWQFNEHHRKHRMTRKEMTDEMKQSEGDPMLKQQRRQKAIDIAMNQMLADVPTSDVIIVNPTHYAVALKWDRGTIGAPVCVAKGVDEIAARIREAAMEHAIPIHSDPPTARSLHATVKIGAEISPDDYAAVAAAIRFAEAIRLKAGKK